MIYYQLYKTASIYRNGLGILDASPQLSEEEINEIDKIIGYNTVFSLDNPFDKIEIKSKYPINFSYYKLNSSSNKKLVFLSNYTGAANHTPNRPGNYFSHVVVFDDIKIKDIPFKYFHDHFNWKKELTIEEDKSYRPKLGTKETSFKKEHFCSDYEDFLNFLFKEEKRIDFFLEIIDYIFSSNFKILEKGQNITIRDKKDNLIDWILCINYLMPQDLSEKITFASYVASPKHYPFKLTGVIPECSIGLSKDYFKVFDFEPFEKTKERQKSLYAKHIKRVIEEDYKRLKEKDDGAYEWDKFLIDIKDIPYTELKPYLEKEEFISRIDSTSTIEEYVEKCINLKREYRKDIWNISFKKDIDLYHKIVIAEIESGNLKQNDNIDLLNNVYKSFVENKEEYRKSKLDDIISTIKKHIKLTFKEFLYVLEEFDCKTNENIELKSILEEIDSDFSDINDITSNQVGKLNLKYKIHQLNLELPNIKKIMNYNELKEEARKDYFINKISKDKRLSENLKSFKPKDKINVLLNALNHDNYFLKKNFENFSNYIKMTNHFLEDEDADFWAVFFERNKPFKKDKDFSYHSLDYLKKVFVSDVFLREYNNLNILQKMEFNDSYTIEWINEKIREGTNKEAILKRFLDYFKNNDCFIKNHKSWYSKIFN